MQKRTKSFNLIASKALSKKTKLHNNYEFDYNLFNNKFLNKIKYNHIMTNNINNNSVEQKSLNCISICLRAQNKNYKRIYA
jgi:hypothetical protein